MAKFPRVNNLLSKIGSNIKRGASATKRGVLAADKGFHHFGDPTTPLGARTEGLYKLMAASGAISSGYAALKLRKSSKNKKKNFHPVRRV